MTRGRGYAAGGEEGCVAAAVIEVRDMRKAYGATEAVRGVSFEVGEGEVFALLGQNGAGKTSVVEILEGYRRADSGEVRVLGEDPARASRSLRERMGIVLQECAVPPYLRVAEVVELYAGYYPTPRDPAEVLAAVGLTDKAGARVRTLSGGQQRRLDLGLALVGRPRVVFLDEPTTGFDPSARRAAWEIVRGMRQGGTTVLLTTHYMDEAQQLADRVAVMVAGRVVAAGDPSSLGGRDRSASRITFRLPKGVAPPDSIPAGSASTSGMVSFDTTAPVAVLHQLTGWALRCGVEVEALSVTGQSLEDVYLELTSNE
ncbi:MAG: ABC transporter ATP-binding protein [Candidatus Dormibacteria bacterium]